MNFFIRETPSSPSSHLRKIVQASLAESFWALGDIDRFSTHPVCNGQLNLTTLFMGIPNYITLRQLIFLQYIVLIKLTLEVKYFAKYINTLLQKKKYTPSYVFSFYYHTFYSTITPLFIANICISAK